MRHLINQIFLLLVLVWGGFVAAQGSETGGVLSFGEEEGLSWSSSTEVLAYEEVASINTEGGELFFAEVDHDLLDMDIELQSYSFTLSLVAVMFFQPADAK